MIDLILTDVLEKLEAKGEPYVLATLVDTKGSAPQDPGAKAVFTKEGLHYGTVGGGKVEFHCQNYAKICLTNDELTQTTFFESWNLQTDIGMTCGGVVSFYFEVSKPENLWQVVVFGAGHVSQSLCPLLTKLDCRVLCIDERQDWLEKMSSHPNLRKVQHPNPKEYLVALPSHSFVLCITQGHATDLPILEEALREHEFPYVGAIGSEVKALRMRRELVERGLSAARAEQFICPIGEAIGNNSPVEIAISIVAQLLKHRDLHFKTSKRSAK